MFFNTAELDETVKQEKMKPVELRFIFPVLLVLSNAACHSYSQSKSPYTEAVSGLTNKRAGTLKNAGCSIKSLNLTAGCLEAKRSSTSQPPPADGSKLQNAPVLLKTYDYAVRDGDLDSSVTGYWAGK